MRAWASCRIIAGMRLSSAALRTPLLVLLVLPLGCVSPSKSAQRKPATSHRSTPPSTQRAPTAARATPAEPRAAPASSAKDFALEMVQAHNEARLGARPTPKPPLPPLVWSDAAARQAASWAKACKFEHNPNRGDFGENLAAATPDMWGTAEVVKSWADEVVDYDHTRNTCKKGKVCGHYTQVVWRKTTGVGCATVLCKKNSPFGASFPTWQLWVCNYTPPGNFVGQRPY
ncbi:CAP domain-containing protein [Myxococcus stipitatus]|uniref:CAP domain-containing protein n=1 Tax=Myxococcus stipitatus TaxID=83455 RepID=UPI00314528E8